MAVFWKGRVIWLDESAQSAAASRGRSYPPIPYDDPSIPYKDEDIPPSPGGIEGPNIASRMSNKENAFWNKFVSSHPRPPKDIERMQLQVAERVLRARQRNDDSLSRRSRSSPEMMERSANIEIERAVKEGYPPEAFSDEALYWRYVSEQRWEYQKEMDNFHSEDIQPG